MEIKNRFLSFFYNKFDFCIRYAYCRMPFISKFLFWKLYKSDFKKLDNEFEVMHASLKKNNFSLNNKVCLELGPGNSYINAYNFLLQGAKKVILVDKFPRTIETKKQKEYFKQELEYIKNKYTKPLFFIKEGKIDPEYMEFIPKDLDEIDMNEKIDFAYSISVFEHIKEVEKNVAKLSTILIQDGLMYHSIELRDHYNFYNPFLFYKYSDEKWKKYCTKEGISYTNRLRYDDYIDLFNKFSFQILEEENKRFEIDRAIKIHSEFKQKNNLDIGTIKVLLVKK